MLRVRRAVTYSKGKFIVGPPKTAAGIRDIAVPPHIRPIIKAHLKNHVDKPADSLLFPMDDGDAHAAATTTASTSSKPATRSASQT